VLPLFGEIKIIILSSYLAIDSTHTAVRRFQLLVRRSGIRCLTWRAQRSDQRPTITKPVRACDVLKSIRLIFTTDGFSYRDERFRCRGQKVEVKGHRGMDYARNSISMAEAYW